MIGDSENLGFSPKFMGFSLFTLMLPFYVNYVEFVISCAWEFLNVAD